MINEVMIKRLDELTADYSSPFFSYLTYAYGMNMNDCEIIIKDLKNDITSGEIIPDNLVLTLEEYFKSKVIEKQKEDKITYLSSLISHGSDFYIRFLEKYDLSAEDENLIFEKIKDKIIKDNITDFEIRRYLEYYFDNSVKQISYISDLNRIIGRNYDTLIIKKAKREYPILHERDISDIVFKMRSDILGAYDFKRTIKDDFLKRCMIKSEEKKARCRENLNSFVFGAGDSFSKLVRFKKLEKSDGEKIVSEIEQEISKGMIQPEEINNLFITRRFNEYNERQ